MSNPAWYFVRGGQQVGPVTMEQAQQYAQLGQLAPDDLVWTEGMADWVPARTVDSIFPVAQGLPPVYPAPMIDYYTPTQHVQFASFWLRFCAAIVDAIITGIFTFLIGEGAGFILEEVMRAQGTSPRGVMLGVAVLNQVLSIVSTWLYEALMTSSRTQATLGKMAVGIRVTDMAGGRISFGRATGRHFAKIISAIILGIGYIMAAFTDKRQALHDMMASTLVVRGRATG